MANPESFVQKALEGDSEAFGELVRLFQDRAVLYAYALLGDRHLAEDAAQSAFLDAYERLAELRTPAAFGGWLKTIVYKQVDRIWRKRNVASASLEVAQSVENVGVQLDDAMDPQSIAEKQESIHAMLNALKQLPPHEREVVGLYYGLDRNQNDIAEFLSVPVSTVNNRLASARKRLKKGMIAMLSEGLQEQSPSQNDAFVKRARAILKASQDGDANEVARLLGEDPSLVRVGDQHRKTPLHVAAEHNQPAVAEILIAAGANVESLTSWGMTPLEWAANMGRRDVAEKLIGAGAKMNMWAAAGLGRLEDVKAFFDSTGGLKPGAAQVRNKQNEKGEWISIPASTDAQQIISEAFQIACRNGHTDVARFLYSHGANINQLGFFQAPGLHWACINGHYETAKYLLELGADRNIRDSKFNGNAMNWAIETEQTAIVDLLLQHGMEMTIGQACIAGRLEIVRTLVEQDEKLVGQFDGWGTPLHQAVLWGRADIVRYLLDHHADRTVKNRDGETAVDLASRGVAGAYRPANVEARKQIWEWLRDSN